MGGQEERQAQNDLLNGKFWNVKHVEAVTKCVSFPALRLRPDQSTDLQKEEDVSEKNGFYGGALPPLSRLRLRDVLRKIHVCHQKLEKQQSVMD